jgi:polysaccharide export outer membrane protein
VTIRISTLAILTIALIAVASARLVAAQEPVPTPERPRVDLRPGDRVRLNIWREPDLSGEYQVDERGEVVFPKLGAMRVTDLSADSLKQLLVHDYTAYLRDPSVEVTLLRRVNVLGAVRSPGLYQVDQTETIADVLAQAGGPTSDGKPDRVELRRDGAKTGTRLTRDSHLFTSGVQSGDQLWVPQRSWLSRNTGLVAAALTATAIVFAATLR